MPAIKSAIGASITQFVRGSILSRKNKEAFGTDLNQTLALFEQLQPLLVRFSAGTIKYNGDVVANKLATILRNFGFQGIADPAKPNEQHFWVHSTCLCASV